MLTRVCLIYVCENTLYVLRGCRRVVQMWKSYIPTDIVVSFYLMDLDAWISHNIKKKDDNGLDWCCLWIIGWYFSWLWCNKDEYVDDLMRPFDMGGFIILKVNDYVKVTKMNSNVMEKDKVLKMIARAPPKRSWIKLNIDRVCKDNMSFGCRGMIRDENGRWISGFAKFLRESNVFMTELWGMYEGIKLTLSLGLRKIKINVDSKMTCMLLIKKIWICGRTCNY